LDHHFPPSSSSILSAHSPLIVTSLREKITRSKQIASDLQRYSNWLESSTAKVPIVIYIGCEETVRGILRYNLSYHSASCPIFSWLSGTF
jgi:hypothetical protein